MVAARAKRGDIGVYFTGLGAVTPIYTVTVKSRVDGQLMKILYKEGEMVHEGDPAGRDRPAALSGAAGAGRRATGQGPGGARERANRPGALQKLLAQKAIPEQQLATQEAMVTQDEGTMKTDQGRSTARS